MNPSNLRPGDVVRHPVRGLLATVTHVRKHRSYANYYAVQVKLDGDGDRVTQWDIRSCADVPVVLDLVRCPMGGAEVPEAQLPVTPGELVHGVRGAECAACGQWVVTRNLASDRDWARGKDGPYVYEPHAKVAK
jgi:hypothetical protein